MRAPHWWRWLRGDVELTAGEMSLLRDGTPNADAMNTDFSAIASLLSINMPVRFVAGARYSQRAVSMNFEVIILELIRREDGPRRKKRGRK